DFHVTGVQTWLFRSLFNHKTKTYKVFKQLAKAIPYVYLLTGTPYRRGVIDFYAPLSLVDPVSFNSYWKYVQKYCRVIDNGFGKEIERTPKNLVEFRKMIRKYASIMRKEDYVKDLPEKDRKSTRLNSSHVKISYAVFCLKKK